MELYSRYKLLASCLQRQSDPRPIELTTLLSPQTIVNFTQRWKHVLDLRVWRVFPTSDAKKTKGHEFEYCCGFCFQKRRAKWRLHLAGKIAKITQKVFRKSETSLHFFFLFPFFTIWKTNGLTYRNPLDDYYLRDEGCRIPKFQNCQQCIIYISSIFQFLLSNA